MAIPYVTGPVHLYCGVTQSVSTSGYGAGFTALLTYPSSNNYIRYLGTCEHAPQVRIASKWKPFLSDLNGGELPFDVAFCGQDSTITMVLTRWNELIFKNYFSCQPRQEQTRGSWTAADVGRLLLHEAYAVPVWFHFPYYSKFSGFNAPQGYRFLATWPLTEEPVMGTQAGKRVLQLASVPVYNPSNGAWKLYDETMTYIPAIPPVTTTGVLT